MKGPGVGNGRTRGVGGGGWWGELVGGGGGGEAEEHDYPLYTTYCTYTLAEI